MRFRRRAWFGLGVGLVALGSVSACGKSSSNGPSGGADDGGAEGAEPETSPPGGAMTLPEGGAAGQPTDGVGGTAALGGEASAPELCEPGERSCQHGDVWACVSTGEKLALLVECADDEVCDSSAPECKPLVCEPGYAECDGSVARSCNAVGTGYADVDDCARRGELCLSGACHEVVCKPEAEFCSGGDVFTCDSLGIGSTLTEDCSEKERCEQSSLHPEWASCLTNACNPGSPTCDGNRATTCNEQGSAPLDGGTDCGDDALCQVGKCKPKICHGAFDCVGGQRAACSADGLSISYYASCLTTETCVKNGNSADCVAHTCIPDTFSCLTNQVGKCGKDGLALASVTKDCESQGQVCTSSSVCADQATDMMGSTEQILVYGTGQLIGNYVKVLSTRRLTELSVRLGLSGSASLRFVVYDADNSSIEVVFDTSLYGQSGTGYFSSGPMAFTLLAGHAYVLGVVINGNSAVAAYADPPPFTSAISFGAATRSLEAPYAPTIDTYYDHKYGDRLFVIDTTTVLN